MSDRDLSNSSSSRSERQAGDAPMIGKVSRSPVSAIAERHGVGRHRRRKGRNLKVIRAWSILFSIIAFMTVITISIYMLKKQRGGGSTQENIYPSLSESNSLPIRKDQHNQTEDLGEKEALKTVAAALENRDPLKFQEFFIPSRISTNAEAIEKLEALVSNEGPVGKMEWIGSRFSNNKMFEEVIIFREKDGRKTNRLAQLFPGSDSNWVIDFDSLMRASSHEWEKIISGEVPTAEIRVFIAPDNYYNGIFSDERKWQAFTLVSPDAKEIMYGYVIRESAQHQALVRIISTESKLHRATLGITSLPDAGERQYQITRVLSESWFVTDEAFDESF